MLRRLLAVTLLLATGSLAVQAQLTAWRTLNRNPGWQEYTGQTNGPSTFAYWTMESPVPWSNEYQLFPMDGGPTDRGTIHNTTYVLGGNTALSVVAQRDIALPYPPLTIDLQQVQARLGSWLGGFLLQADYAMVTATFKDSNRNPLPQQMSLGPVTPNDRGGVTKMLYRSSLMTVPPRSRYVDIVVRFVRFEGVINNACADNTTFETRTYWGGGGSGNGIGH